MDARRRLLGAALGCAVVCGVLVPVLARLLALDEQPGLLGSTSVSVLAGCLLVFCVSALASAGLVAASSRAR